MPRVFAPANFTPQQAATRATVKWGSKGASVEALQALLKRAGYDPGGVDGQFLGQTDAALRDFQAAHGLLSDGIAGPATWEMLEAVDPNAAASPSRRPVLRLGAQGDHVRQLQLLLEREGFDVAIDGAFGGETQQQLIAYQAQAQLDPDGVAGPVTWESLGARARGGAGAMTPSSMSRLPPSGSAAASTAFRRDILARARLEIGTREATGRNDGAVAKYPRLFGRPIEKYCADFVSWVIRHAGGVLNDPYCPSIEKKLKARGLWKGLSNPEPGDLVLFDWDDDNVPDHIGIVEAVNDDGTVTTIEGNTSDPDSGREGVWRRTRSLSTVLGFGKPY